jgi:hypothetical protein
MKIKMNHGGTETRRSKECAPKGRAKDSLSPCLRVSVVSILCDEE